MADNSNAIKALVVRAEDARLLGNMSAGVPPPPLRSSPPLVPLPVSPLPAQMAPPPSRSSDDLLVCSERALPNHGLLHPSLAVPLAPVACPGGNSGCSLKRKPDPELRSHSSQGYVLTCLVMGGCLTLLRGRSRCLFVTLHCTVYRIVSVLVPHPPPPLLLSLSLSRLLLSTRRKVSP